MKSPFQLIMIVFGEFLILFVVGKLLIISPLQREIDKSLAAEKMSIEARQLLAGKIKDIQFEQSGSPQSEPESARFFKVGKEALLMKQIYNSASSSKLIIEFFDLMKTLEIKQTQQPSEEEAYQNNAGTSQGSFPTLDEQGMPIGVEKSEEAPKKAGLEFLPLQIDAKGSFPEWGNFLSQLDRSLPLFGINSLKLKMEKSNSLKGTILLVFPVEPF